MVDCTRCISDRDLTRVKSEAEDKHRDFDFGVLTFAKVHIKVSYSLQKYPLQNIRYRPHYPTDHLAIPELSDHPFVYKLWRCHKLHVSIFIQIYISH